MDDNVIRRLQEELDRITETCTRAERQWKEAEADRAAIERSIAILSRRLARTGSVNVSAGEIADMTQEQAIVFIAERNEGVLRSGSAKQLLLEAGLIAKPKNAASILYTVIQRSDRFEQIRRGEYRLMPSAVDDIRSWFADDLHRDEAEADRPTLREMVS